MNAEVDAIQHELFDSSESSASHGDTIHSEGKSDEETPSPSDEEFIDDCDRPVRHHERNYIKHLQTMISTARQDGESTVEVQPK
jgi:hypothetical protein